MIVKTPERTYRVTNIKTVKCENCQKSIYQWEGAIMAYFDKKHKNITAVEALSTGGVELTGITQKFFHTSCHGL